jgi:hypothetical protein
MTSKSVKILALGSAIALLAAGCSKSQPQANNNPSGAPAQAAMQNQPPPFPGNASSTFPGRPHNGTASSTRPGFGMPNLPPGSRPFFGTVASVSGSQITISGHSRNSSSTVSTIIDITGSTQFTGGSQSSIISGARVAGVGTVNSDGSITASSLQINPSFSGRGQGANQGGGNYQPQSSQ